MIDWKSLASNAFWVLGLSVMLAALSWTSYRAAADRWANPLQPRALGRRLRARDFRRPFLVGLALVFLGALVSCTGIWVKIVSGAGLAMSLLALWASFRRGPAKGPGSHGE